MGPTAAFVAALACHVESLGGQPLPGSTASARTGTRHSHSDQRWGAVSDWRNVSTGLPIWPPVSNMTKSYQDQPQVQVLADGTWFVVWTHGTGTNEGSPNVILSARSTSQGRSWSPPVEVEPLARDASSSASWANPLLVGDRLYVFYTYNCWHTGPGGNAGVAANLTRDARGGDSNLLGCYFYKVSTD
eukprot:SAG11_NODE_11959_length_729_cov_0.858730_1_plen_187_part_01